jgi:hypothetical protein
MALIVSPRVIIQQDADISLLPDLPLDTITQIESNVEQTFNVSALIVNVGGIGAYPTMVMRTTDISWQMGVVAHEWTHNYLTLRPLGMNYESSSEVRTMNETTANLAESEIRQSLLALFYPELLPPPTHPNLVTKNQAAPAMEDAFDFNHEMHKTRVEVDRLLGAGLVEQAEAYMEARRIVFWDHGYQIRRLNQAYFAFHGAYADAQYSAAGEDPVGPAVRAFRSQCSSLKDFLKQISRMYSFVELQQALNP